MGCDVDAVEHGEDACEQAQRQPYDVIVLDIEMPVMDGVAAARVIRAQGGASASTPIMALSAFLADTAKVCSLRDAFDLTLAKPAGREELFRAFARILQTPA
jgi:CheY-like chemotaxis protein